MRPRYRLLDRIELGDAAQSFRRDWRWARAPALRPPQRVAQSPNGVGVRADGKVIFAISQGEVSFDAFARLFRYGLNCPNALFLDGGSAASLYAPSLTSFGNIVSLGPMLAVFRK